jgi:hypothetical protein
VDVISRIDLNFCGHKFISTLDMNELTLNYLKFIFGVAQILSFFVNTNEFLEFQQLCLRYHYSRLILNSNIPPLGLIPNTNDLDITNELQSNNHNVTIDTDRIAWIIASRSKITRRNIVTHSKHTVAVVIGYATLLMKR